MATLGVSLMVKNEEIMLEDCLKSVKGVDEIVVLDTGSTDSTGEIARRYTDKFIEGEYEWKDDFGDARTASMDRCTTDWILCLDADERVIEGGIQLIRQAIEAASEDVDSIAVIMKGQNETFWSDRVFRNLPRLRFVGKVHESCPTMNSLRREDIVIEFNASPNHTPERNFKIIEKCLAENPHDTRMMYCAGREYFCYNYFPNAIYWFERYKRAVVSIWGPEYADALFTLAWCYANMGEYAEAKSNCLEAIRVNPDFKEALELMAELCEITYDKLGQERWSLFASTAQNRGLNFLSKGTKNET